MVAGMSAAVSMAGRVTLTGHPCGVGKSVEDCPQDRPITGQGQFKGLLHHFLGLAVDQRLCGPCSAIPGTLWLAGGIAALSGLEEVLFLFLV